jgi:hypothetical protein
VSFRSPDPHTRPRRYRLTWTDGPGQSDYVRALFAAAGWSQTHGADFDLFWDLSRPTAERCRSIAPGQCYSHLWGIDRLSVKSRLHNRLDAARARLGARGAALYDFFPRSFSMPEEREEWRAAADASPQTIWIQKPKALSAGRGVELVRDLDAVPNGPEWMVQEYLSSPHLLDGYKYTLRLYVLLLSLDPLEALLYREGFCKFASRRFRLDGDALADRFIHLTNPDVLRDDPETPVSSRNLTHAGYRARLRSDGIDDEALWRRIRRAVALTLIAARGAMLARMRADDVGPYRGFELLGLDVLIDAQLRPWLIECNLLPSLTVEADASTPSARAETAVKRGVIADTLAALGVPVTPPPDAAGYAPLVPADPDLIDAFVVPRARDLARWGVTPPPIRLIPDAVVSHPFGDHLALLDCDLGRVRLLDAAQAEIWRGAEAGRTPSELGDAWDALADWADAGLLRRRDAPGLDDEALGRAEPIARVPGVLEGGAARVTVGRSDASLALPDAGVEQIVLDNGRGAERAVAPHEGLARLIDAGLRAEAPLAPSAGRALLGWLAARRFSEIGVPAPRATPDLIVHCLERLVDQLEAHGLWYALAYGTLLGAVRDGDVIPWDYDFDLLVRADELERLLALGAELARDGITLAPTRKPANFLALNPRAVESFWSAAVGVFHHGRKVGDLYVFSLFSDGVMRRWDFDTDVYWCPHSSFPHFFVEDRGRASIRGRSYAVPREPEKWIEGIYGMDWRIPYRAVVQGGVPRAGATIHSDRYEPKLRAEIDWCVARGWDPSRYAGAHTWPRPIGGAGPIGPTARTRDNSRSLWWRDLDELVEHF